MRLFSNRVKPKDDDKTLSQILCKHPFQLNGDRRGNHQNQS